MKKVLITGATSGIGEALCLYYQAIGYDVIACGRKPDKLAQLESYNNVSTIAVDLCDQQQVTEKMQQLGSLDLVILNAGSCEYMDDVKHFDGQLFARVINSNVIAMGYCLAALLPQIPAGGQLALVGSSASYLPFSRAQAYGASKAAVAYLARSLALDLKSQHIDVSLVSPGFVKTPLTDKNDFAMPMQISAQEAAKRIVTGLQKRTFDIHFPKRFTLILKTLSLLPDSWWRLISTRILQK
ncbi:MAG: short-subunit dehydrogenase [Psychromonas sp.]|jgi:short-subunit dehydrogenase|uniref:SDR family NAD(P)-dependent oxidoreductase n=1 Tax=Psychromonas sp. TaxID=1884585 RepID=UPI0039E284D9